MEEPAHARRSAAIALALAALGIGLAVIIERFGKGWVGQNRSTLIAAAWLYLPLIPILTSRKPSSYHGIGPGAGLRGLGETIAASTAVLVPFYAVFFMIYPARWGLHTLPKSLWTVAAAQFMAVALPEEFFFRGYLQTELESFSAKKIRLLGAELGWGWPAAAAIFALGHVLVLPTPVRAAVFFPALLFGWLRVRTGSILYPAIMHALFNFTFLAAQKMAVM